MTGNRILGFRRQIAIGQRVHQDRGLAVWAVCGKFFLHPAASILTIDSQFDSLRDIDSGTQALVPFFLQPLIGKVPEVEMSTAEFVSVRLATAA